jgi:hypothetical protein
MLRVLILALVLAVGFGAAPTAMAGEKGFKIKVLELPPEIRKHVLNALKSKGIEPNKNMTLSATTDKCPSSCNDSASGGYCRCDPDDKGNCPGGTEKQGAPGSEYCRVRIPKADVSGGGLKDPVQILMP